MDAVMEAVLDAVMDAVVVKIGNGLNTVSRVLFGGEINSLNLTEFWGKLGEFCEKLGEFALAHKDLTEFSPRNSVRANRLTEFGV